MAANVVGRGLHPAHRLAATKGIAKGVPLKHLLGPQTVSLIGESIGAAAKHHSVEFRRTEFEAAACNGLDALELKPRAAHVAAAMRSHLPKTIPELAQVLVTSMGPPDSPASLASFFFMPHSSLLESVAREPAILLQHFDLLLQANLALTKRFTAEFSIRPFFELEPERTIRRFTEMLDDTSDGSAAMAQHCEYRRLVSEGSRPRLPWAPALVAFKRDPAPVLPLLDRLKWDSSLFVRRSVANHVGDILKDNEAVGLKLCEKWIAEASSPKAVKKVLATRAAAAPNAGKTARHGKPRATLSGPQTLPRLGDGPYLWDSGASSEAEDNADRSPSAANSPKSLKAELLWVVRHALRTPARNGNRKAQKLRASAAV